MHSACGYVVNQEQHQDAVDDLFAVSDEGRSQQALQTTPDAT